MNSKLETRNSKLRVAIYGGSGYGGSELLRILLMHPNVEISFVTANEQAGKSVGEVHRNLAGLTDLVFSGAPDGSSSLTDVDCVFLALPHGQAMAVVPTLPAHVKAIDSSRPTRV
jgi:N-acetyl-gamma-glutamylphosphate reductase